MLLGFCAETADIWRILGYVVVVIKIVIPLILIILGMVDLGKAVVSSDEKAINKSVGSLIRRFIAAVVIFFVPTIISAIFDALNLIDNPSDYNVCVQCVTNVGNCPQQVGVGSGAATGIANGVSGATN